MLAGGAVIEPIGPGLRLVIGVDLGIRLVGPFGVTGHPDVTTRMVSHLRRSPIAKLVPGSTAVCALDDRSHQHNKREQRAKCTPPRQVLLQRNHCVLLTGKYEDPSVRSILVGRIMGLDQP